MNKIFFKLFTFLFILFSTLSASAFSVNRGAFFNKSIFGIEFPNGTSFYGAANLVTGVSLQRYFVGTHLVTEVVVDVNSSGSQLRIYSMDEASSEDLSTNQEQFNNAMKLAENYLGTVREKMKDFLPTDQTLVFKEYPTTTHAKTLEYRVALVDLLKFYKAFSTDYTKTSSTTDDEGETVVNMSKTSVNGTKYSF